MTKDEIQAALSSFNSAMAYNPKIMSYCEKEIIRAALQSALDGASVSNVWQLVPKEPTPDMMQAGSQVWKDETNGTWGHSAVVYTTMLSAAPKPPTDTKTLGGASLS